MERLQVKHLNNHCIFVYLCNACTVCISSQIRVLMVTLKTGLFMYFVIVSVIPEILVSSGNGHVVVCIE